MAVIVDAELENWRLKVLSLLCALALYAQSHSGQDAKSVVVNLEAQLPDREDKVLATMLPPGVRITIKGTGAELDNLRASSLGLQVDLRGARSGHVTFEPRMVRGPAGARFEVIEFDSAGIDVEWEDRIKRDVPVQRIDGTGMFVGTGHLALQTSGAFDRIDVKRLLHGVSSMDCWVSPENKSRENIADKFLLSSRRKLGVSCRNAAIIAASRLCVTDTG